MDGYGGTYGTIWWGLLGTGNLPEAEGAHFIFVSLISGPLYLYLFYNVVQHLHHFAS